jgi:hypothetical protein
MREWTISSHDKGSPSERRPATAYSVSTPHNSPGFGKTHLAPVPDDAMEIKARIAHRAMGTICLAHEADLFRDTREEHPLRTLAITFGQRGCEFRRVSGLVLWNNPDYFGDTRLMERW